MSKFNNKNARPATGLSPIRTTKEAATALGGAGYLRDEKSELFLLATSNMVGERTSHEGADQRDSRFEQLTKQIAVEDFAWLCNMAAWLRGEANMRSASTLLAAHAIHARSQEGLSPANGPLLDSVLRRPDEPGEFLAAWHGLYGRSLPKGLRLGLGEAVRRLYTERNFLKYDGQTKAVRFADIINLVHPKPVTERGDGDWQGHLFGYLLDQHHHGDGTVTDMLTTLSAQSVLRQAVRANPEILYDASRVKAAGMTWEDVLSLGGELRLDKRRLWEAVIPSMPMQALIKNLRNFDQAGVSDRSAQVVLDKLSDPEQVHRSRLFPFRFHTAYREAPSLRWGHALDKALGSSLANVPKLRGRTLILVDTSTSMKDALSEESTVLRWDVATLFGVALGLRCESSDVVSFSSTCRFWGDPRGALTKRFPLREGESLLRAIDRWKSDGFFLGGGTDTALALRKEFASHDRVVIVTDEQQGSSGAVSSEIPESIPLYTWNLAGYKVGHGKSGVRNRHTFGGLSDSAFRLIPVLEAGRSGRWPWEA